MNPHIPEGEDEAEQDGSPGERPGPFNLTDDEIEAALWRAVEEKQR